jgi:outer membrane protein with beta-barrel domain
MEKFYRILLFAIAMFAFTQVKAQNWALGVRGGISIPNLTAGGSEENPLNTGYSSRLGPDAGIFAEFKVSNLFSIQPMIEYSSQGGKKDGFQAFPTPSQEAAEFPPGQAPTYLYANFNSTAKLNYMAVPVLAKFGWDLKNSPLRIYVDAGPFVSFLLSAHQVTSGNSQVYADPSGQQALPGGSQPFNANQDIKDQLNKTDFGVEGNLGLAYRIKGAGDIFIEGGGNYGFLNIQQGTANGKNNTGAATVTVGYAYWFGK